MNSSDEKESRNALSRRRFFAAAGSFMTGAVATAAGCAMLTQKEPAPEPKIAWPYPYAKIDPELVRKRAHLGYYKGK